VRAVFIDQTTCEEKGEFREKASAYSQSASGLGGRLDGLFSLREEATGDVAMHIGEAEITSLEAIGQALMINATEV
jgi:hypothetical protein